MTQNKILAAPTAAKGWYSRGYLPHVDAPGVLQCLTFRLADSLPSEVRQRIAQEAHSEAARLKGLALALDAGYGQCWLRRDELAAVVEQALLHFDGQRYRLLAWCVMPNHVHGLIEAFAGAPLPKVMQSWKSFTAKAINRWLGRSGEVWQREYFDRYIRDDAHLRAVIDYIEGNPVAAGLVGCAEDWGFSSAAQRERSRRDAGAPSDAPLRCPVAPFT